MSQTIATPTRRDPIPTAHWRGVVAKYQGGSVADSVAQLTVTLVLLGATYTAMCFAFGPAPWLTVLLMPLATGFVIRTFIFMHDCAHGSFLPSQRWNDAVGYATGVLSLTPFAQWRRDHAMHHATSGNLDRRGTGDVYTLTVSEYLALSRWKQLGYRLVRNPVFLLFVGPLYLVATHRLRPRVPSTGAKQTLSVWMTNAGIAAILALLWWTIGIKMILLVILPPYYLAFVTGVWLFYVQHQFEDAYWEEHKDWDYATAAINGSSYLRLPTVLRWFTGNIGLHHVHHLGPRIPNYRLQRAHDENEIFHEAPVLTMREGVRALTLSLWDEARHRLIRFRDLRARQP